MEHSGRLPACGYSGHDAPPANGLDETLEIVVNGYVHRVPPTAGLPVYDEGKSMTAVMRWHDFGVPRRPAPATLGF